MAGQTTWLGAQRPLPGARVRLGSAVRASPPMARNLPTYRRGRAPQAGRDAANRSTRRNPARNLFALIRHQGHWGAPASYRRDSSFERQNMVDRALGPGQCAGDITRALASLPTL